MNSFLNFVAEHPYVATWLSGIPPAILIIAYKEKKRLGGKLFYSLIEEVRDLPFPAAIGYLLAFILSWATVLNHTLIERD